MDKKIYDVEITKEVAIDVFTVGNAIGKSFEDGKIGFDDFVHFIPILPKMKKIYDNAKLIPRELADMDKEEAEEVKNCIKETFDIKNDVLEERIEDAFALMLEIVRFITGFKK